MTIAARRRTKIVATIGPASSDADLLHALVDAGMDGARLNFSHGTHEQHAERVELIRQVQEHAGRPLALIADLQGPKLRVGELTESVDLRAGEEIELVGGEHGENGALPVSPAVIGDVLRPGHDVLIDGAGSKARVIAKIEKAEAVDALDAVLEETDAVMVARGDLGVEIGPARVPLVQKRIILKSLERGKPAITATQMLESMIHQPEPTRAEASDVANAILDGTSAVMLSGETAIGEYPLESVRTMTAIAMEVEPSLGYRHQLPDASEEPSVGSAMSNAACDLAEALGAASILVPTFSGRTASAVARLRPRRPVVALSHHQYALQQMALEWGVTPLRIPEGADVEELWSTSMDAARNGGLVQSGDRVVITAGTAVNIPGSTNVIKVDVA